MSKNISVNEKIDLTALDPTLLRIVVAAGWEAEKDEHGADVDVDMSIFLLNRADMTREDSDFVFYNNPSGEAGAVSHTGSQLTGGSGDDKETILVDLNGLHFDVEKLVLSLSIYNPMETNHHFGMVKNRYIRIINRDTSEELVRFDMPDSDDPEIGYKWARIERDGVSWHFEVLAEPIQGGLSKLAQDYGMMIQGT